MSTSKKTTNVATLAPAVEDAARRLAEARQSATEAKDRCASLRESLLAGGNVTAKALADAGHAKEYADLSVEAASLALEGARRQARLERLEELAREIQDGAGLPAEILEAMEMIQEGARRIVAATENRRKNLYTWVSRLQRDGVPQLDTHGKVRTNALGVTSEPYRETSEDHGNLGWREAGMGRGASVHVGGRAIADVSSGVLISAAIARGGKAAGLPNVRYIGISGDPVQELAADPAAWLEARF